MTKTYPFGVCYALLRVDPKTFRRWLEKAGIDPEQQVSKADSRIRYLTQEQLDQLAHDHERDLSHTPEQHDEGSLSGKISLMSERLDTLENATSDIEELRSQVGELRTQINAIADQVRALQELQDAQAKRPATRPTRSMTRFAAVGAPVPATTLPEGLVSWRQFADLHHTPRNVTSQYISQGFIRAIRGKWKDSQGVLKEALDAQGRHDFWVQFHQTDGFLSCDDCPHDIPGK
jgi:outer membrane murein-binding lipoprotein Lpp